MNQHKELDDIYQRKLPIMIKEDIKINSTRSTIDYEKINNEKFVLDYVTISLIGNCSDPLSKDIILIIKQILHLHLIVLKIVLSSLLNNLKQLFVYMLKIKIILKKQNLYG